MAKIFLLYLSRLFTVEIRHEAHIVTAGIVGSVSLLLGRIVGRIWIKAVMGIFWLTLPLLNGYGEKVNGSLIHANRLAFGRVRDYLCIVAAP